MERSDFDALVKPELPMLTRYVRRMIGDPDDTLDLVQDTLLRAYQSIDTFRGDSKFSTWLIAIATRRCLDHLRAKQRWSWDAQEVIRKHLYETLGDGARAHLFPADYRYDVHEHIAFCFTCVGRSLDPLAQAALVLSDVLGLTDRESAHALELSESVFRHRLADARREMHERFEGLCALVNKQGVCHQCKGLRMQTPIEEHRGPATPELGSAETSADEKRRLRLNVVRDGELHDGVMQPFHDKLWRALERYAESRSLNS